MDSQHPQAEAPSVPLALAQSEQGLTRAQAAKVLTARVLGPDNTAEARRAVVDGLQEIALMVASEDKQVAADAIAALSIFTAAVPRLRAGGELTEATAANAMVKVGWVASELMVTAARSSNAEPPVEAFQAAGMLRSMVRLSHSGAVDIASVPGLEYAMLDAAIAYPQAIHPGLICETLSPSSPKVIALLHTSVISHGNLPRPGVVPKPVVQAVFAALEQGRVHPREVASGVPDWTTAVRALPESTMENLASSVLMHPGLPASDAGRLCAALCASNRPRVVERTESALTAAVETLRSRLSINGEGEITARALAHAIVERGDEVRRVSTLLALRSLAGAAGRGDEAADVLAAEMLQGAIIEPSTVDLPRTTVAALAVNLAPDPQDERIPQGMSANELMPWRLVSALARITAPMGEAGRWASFIRDQWHCLSPDLDRGRAWSALTLAMDLLTQTRPPSELAMMMNRLLRRGVPEGSVAGENHQQRLEADLDRIAGRPIALPMHEGTAQSLLNVTFIPGWRFGVGLEEIERARRDQDWQPSHAARWLDPEAVAVLANGELCGWFKPNEASNTLSVHSKSLPDAAGDDAQEHRQRTLDVVLTTVALTVASESKMAMEGEIVGSSLDALGQMGGNELMMGWQDNRIGSTEVTQLAESAGLMLRPPSVEITSEEVFTSPVELPAEDANIVDEVDGTESQDQSRRSFRRR